MQPALSSSEKSLQNYKGHLVFIYSLFAYFSCTLVEII